MAAIWSSTRWPSAVVFENEARISSSLRVEVELSPGDAARQTAAWQLSVIATSFLELCLSARHSCHSKTETQSFQLFMLVCRLFPLQAVHA